MTDIITKLSTIQAKLKVPKNQYNEFGGFNYRSCEDILETVKPLLTETKTILLLSDKVVEVGGRIYINATATISDGTSELSASALARESETKKGMDEAQITGSASSYARKYALNGLFAIDDERDGDTRDNTKLPTYKASTKDKPYPKKGSEIKATPKQISAINSIIAKSGQPKSDIYKKYGVSSLKDLTITQASETIQEIGQ